MKPYAHLLFAAVFLLFTAMGCSDNPAAFDEAEEDVLLGNVEALRVSKAVGYATGRILFVNVLKDEDIGVKGQVKFNVLEVLDNPRRTGKGSFVYTELKGGEAWFRAGIKRFVMTGEHAALFAGPVLKGTEYEAGKWVYVRIVDGGASGDKLRYTFGPPMPSIKNVIDLNLWKDLTIAGGDIACGMVPSSDAANFNNED